MGSTDTFATSYPPWFPVLMWALMLTPLYPGLLLTIMGTWMTTNRRMDGRKLLALGLVALALGIWLVVRYWDTFDSGNPYHLF